MMELLFSKVAGINELLPILKTNFITSIYQKFCHYFKNTFKVFCKFFEFSYFQNF